MKKRGFTLIELLAVIVILAIIALIATPIVTNIISDSRKGASERSAENYIKQVEATVANSYMNTSDKMQDGVYYIQKDSFGNPTGKITTNYNSYDIDISGTKPADGILYIKNGQVMNGSYLKINSDIVNFIDEKGEINNKYSKKSIGTKIYYDPVANKKVVAATDTECAENCKIFYVLEDKGIDYASVSLIMDRNIGDPTVAWINSDDYINLNIDGTSCSDASCNDEGPITANNYLKSQTSTWKDVIVSLPTYDQIYNVNGSENVTTTSWLYGNINSTSVPYGYWTSTPVSDSITRAWEVFCLKKLQDSSVYFSNRSGVRPVITVLKSQL